jgi:hypothetical protein
MDAAGDGAPDFARGDLHNRRQRRTHVIGHRGSPLRWESLQRSPRNSAAFFQLHPGEGQAYAGTGLNGLEART